MRSADARQENSITVLRSASSAPPDLSLCDNEHVLGAGGRSGCHPTRLDLTRLPSYLSQHLQLVLNAAARLHLWLTTLRPCVGSINLQWLRIPQRIQFKVAILTYKILHGCAPSYLGSFVRVADLPSRRALRSANTSRLIQPQSSRSTVGDRAFPVAGPRSGIVCHRWSHQSHPWTPFAGVWRLICSQCHIQTYNDRNWLTVISGPCSKSLLRSL